MLVLLAAVNGAAATPACALCMRSPGYNLETELQAALKYFDCVEAAQTEQLLSIREAINQLADDQTKHSIDPDDIADLQFRVRMIQEALDKIAPKENGEPSQEFWWKTP
ncbi:hypothetical protein [Mesorhizobium sp.]|uniref:hypothetical protein n=1 Tax=Mesorhizobium sp. TaxID=1871066 RepID=UPI000FE55CBE|nr:hypothetical protein [Mesorhizobium sp.]RWE90102.1 MAG: hypothetical protein EOS68_31400 [Mesorhizobium sp.]